MTDISNDKLLEIISVQTEIVQLGADLSSIMDLVTHRSQEITGADGASIELIQEQELVYSAASGIAEKFLGLRLNIDNSLSGECIKTRTTLLSNDIEKDDRVNKDACRLIGLNSMIVVPLICQEDVVGIMKVLSRNSGHFCQDNISSLELMSGLIAAAMFHAMKNDESELFHRATHDSLTGVSNRSVFYDRLRQKLASASRKHENFGIISLDMDGLKEINDVLGHRAGDAAIRETATRIQQVLRETDTVSRLGGDEFGIIVSSIVNRNEIRTLTHRIETAISEPFTFEEQDIKLRASLGYTLFSEDGIELEILIEKADESMYATKRKRKETHNVC